MRLENKSYKEQLRELGLLSMKGGFGALCKDLLRCLIIFLM